MIDLGDKKNIPSKNKKAKHEETVGIDNVYDQTISGNNGTLKTVNIKQHSCSYYFSQYSWHYVHHTHGF